jgi:S1-C subfamily serine protease
MIDQLVLVSSDPSKRLFRGDIGISLDLISYKTATSNYKLSQQILNDRHHPISNNNKFLLINSIYPNSSAYDILKPGDIIYKVNKYIISDNLILFDEFINNSKEM